MCLSWVICSIWLPCWDCEKWDATAQRFDKAMVIFKAFKILPQPICNDSKVFLKDFFKRNLPTVLDPGHTTTGLRCGQMKQFARAVGLEVTLASHELLEELLLRARNVGSLRVPAIRAALLSQVNFGPRWELVKLPRQDIRDSFCFDGRDYNARGDRKRGDQQACAVWVRWGDGILAAVS